MSDEFERIVTMSGAFDKRHSDPSKNYGIHGVELRMVLKGPIGATQFVLYTGWHLPHVAAEIGNSKPMGADKGYHWPTPQYEGQDQMDCAYVAGGKCYYDGSSLNAENTFETLLNKGSDGVWAELEEMYRELAARQP